MPPPEPAVPVDEDEEPERVKDEAHGREVEIVKVRGNRQRLDSSSSANDKKTVQNVRAHNIAYHNFWMLFPDSGNSRHEFGQRDTKGNDSGGDAKTARLIVENKTYLSHWNGDLFT